MTEPSEYEKDTRILLSTLANEVKSDFNSLGLRFDKLNELVTNHLLYRLPPYITIVISILVGIISFMGGSLLKTLIGG